MKWLLIVILWGRVEMTPFESVTQCVPRAEALNVLEVKGVSARCVENWPLDKRD